MRFGGKYADPVDPGGRAAYDNFNRLTHAAEAGSWSETSSYDRWGNRWVSASSFPLNLSTPTAATQFNTATNRLQQQSNGQPLPPNAYDAQGNLTNHPWIGEMSYDAEGKIWRHIKGGTTVEFTYDGEGRRVKKRVGTAPPTIYVYDAGGQLAADYGTADGTLNCSTCYITADHLGSTRLTTGETGAPAGRLDYFPFGETIPGGASFGNRPSPTGPRQKFTGKERDQETNLDYFIARYYSAAQGRFTSPDAPFADQFPEDPQSWSLYSYARNNPLKHVDRTGRAIETAWDLLNIGLGVKSFVDNVQSGNYAAAALDAVGVVADSAAAVVPFVPGGAGSVIKGARLAGKADEIVDGVRALKHADAAGDAGKSTLNLAEGSVGGLRKAGKSDAHHVIQDASVRDLPGYSSSAAPGVQLPGPASKPGTPHNATRSVQQQRGGGTYAAERRIGYKALRKAGATRDQARQQIKRADEYFDSIGVTGDTTTRIPRDRR